MTEVGTQSRGRSVIKLDASLAADARAAVRFLRGRGETDLQLGEFLDRLVADGLRRIRDQHNDGQPFSTPGDPLPRGGQPR